MIQVKDLHFAYPGAESEALQGLTLSVPQGSLFGLLGPNGAGKTTLISIMTGLLPAPAGAVAVDSHDLGAQLAEIQGFCSLVPQEYAFYPRLTPSENLSFFAQAQRLPASLAAERISAAVEVTGLGAFLHKRAELLSGGLKRRLNFAIGLLNQPRLLFLDEPTVGIDPQSRHFILEAVRKLNAQGTTVVYTTHYMDEVEQLCDRIAIMDAGKILAEGDLAGLLALQPVRNLEELFLNLTQRRLRD